MRERRKLRTRLVSVLAAVGAGLVASSAAHAEDGKIYPAITCQPALDGTPSTLSYGGDRITNTSTSYSVVVACPIIKDNVYSSNGGNQGNVRYYKGSEYGVLADVHARSIYGTSSYDQYRSDFAAGTGYRTLSFSALSGFSQGYYFMMIVLPPGATTQSRTHVYSYRFDEND